MEGTDLYLFLGMLLSNVLLFLLSAAYKRLSDKHSKLHIKYIEQLMANRILKEIKAAKDKAAKDRKEKQ